MHYVEFIPKHIVLADDDDDDRLLFHDVLKEFPSMVELIVANDGEKLMKLLQNVNLPDLLFLDLNMPLKNGFECLEEIKKDEKFKNLPVIIFSTSSQPSAIDQVYRSGAHLYVRKPNDFATLKKVIHYVLTYNWLENPSQPSKEQFVLTI